MTNMLKPLTDWLYSMKDKFWIILAPYWRSYIQPYWKYSIAFTMGSLTFTIFSWNYAKRLSNMTDLQLAVEIYNKYSVESLNKDPTRIEHIRMTYFPKCKTQPSTELLSSYMMFRSMEFGNFKQCPKGTNKYNWFIEQHRDNEFLLALIPCLPSFVDKPKQIVIDTKNDIKLHCLCYYKSNMKNMNVNGVVYHVHGGSFIGGDIETLYPMLYEVSRRSGMVIFSIDYRLCPDDGVTIINQVDDCILGYKYLLKTLSIQSNNICIIGESSGATLVLLLLQKLKLYANEYLFQPNCAVLQSPCTDLSYSLPSCKINQKYDCLEGFVEFPNPCLNMAVGNIDKDGNRVLDVDENKKESKYSPLYGDWTGLCDLYFIAGEHEMLIDDAKCAMEEAMKCNVKVEYYWDPYCGHCPPTWSMMCDEGKDAMSRMMQYIKRKMNK